MKQGNSYEERNAELKNRIRKLCADEISVNDEISRLSTENRELEIRVKKLEMPQFRDLDLEREHRLEDHDRAIETLKRRIDHLTSELEQVSHAQALGSKCVDLDQTGDWRELVDSLAFQKEPPRAVIMDDQICISWDRYNYHAEITLFKDGTYECFAFDRNKR